MRKKKIIASLIKRFHYREWPAQIRWNGQIPALKAQTNKIWLCLIFLLAADALTTPYAGLVHDARLYAVQALSHLHPDYYKRDLFFLYGSQDSFTIFSLLYSGLIALLSLQPAALVMYIASRVVFFLGVLLFFRACSKDNLLSFLAALIIASGQIHFFFFDVNEPFLTPRLAAYGLSLLSLACLINRATIRCLLTICAAGLFHPLVAIAPGAIIAIYWLRQGRGALICSLAGGLVVVVTILFFISPEAFHNLNLWQFMDAKWQYIVFTRSKYLLPANWSSEEWQGVLAALLMTGISIKYCDKHKKSFLKIILLVTLSSLLISIFLTYTLPIAFGIQLQLWRSVWLIRLMAVLLALTTGKRLWLNQRVTHKCAAILLAFPFVLSSVAATGGLLYILSAFMILSIPVRYTAPIDKLRWLPMLLAVCLIFVQLSAVFFYYQTYYHLTLSCYKNIITSLSILSPVLPLIIIVVVIVMLAKANIPTVACLCVIIYLWVLYFGMLNKSWYPEQLQNERNIIKPEIPKQLVKWQKIIPPGSLILSDSIPTKFIWFILRSSSYYSAMQGAGILFNRNLTINYDKRREEVRNFFSPGKILDKERWCNKRNIKYIISRERLPLTLLTGSTNYNLYIIH